MPYPVAAVRNKNFGSPQYSALILSLGPIAYWPLNDASGTAAVNLVDTALNGAYTGVDLAQAQAPFVAPLFGTGDYCNIYTTGLNTVLNRSEGSAVAWVKVAASGVWTDGADRKAFYIASASNQEIFHFGRQMGLTWSVAGDAVKAYKNNAQVGTTQATLGTPSGNALTNTVCTIGAQNTVANQPWSGWIAHFQLYDRALSLTEIGNLYAWGV